MIAAAVLQEESPQYRSLGGSWNLHEQIQVQQWAVLQWAVKESEVCSSSSKQHAVCQAEACAVGLKPVFPLEAQMVLCKHFCVTKFGAGKADKQQAHLSAVRKKAKQPSRVCPRRIITSPAPKLSVLVHTSTYSFAKQMECFLSK